MAKFNGVQKALQRDDVTMAEVRAVFDSVIEQYPDMSGYIAADAKIVHSSAFERAVVKIQDKEFSNLTIEERTVSSNLLLQTPTDAPLESDKEDFAMDIIKKRRLGSTKKEEFMNTNFLLPTSNIIERFFSSATFAFDDHRQRLLPIHLEEQLFLKINNKFWDEKLVSGIC